MSVFDFLLITFMLLAVFVRLNWDIETNADRIIVACQQASPQEEKK